MPYSIKFIKGDKRPWKVIKKDTGEEVGSSTSKADAEASIRARGMGEAKEDWRTVRPGKRIR